MGNLFMCVIVLLAGLMMGRVWFLIAVGWLVGTAVQKAVTRQHCRTSDKQPDATVRSAGSRHMDRMPNPPVTSTEPDGPVPFGYKTSWLAVRCDDPERVMAALRPASRQSANWSTGLAHTNEDTMFVSPALDAWVLVVDGEASWDDPEVLERLVHTFPEVQLYASHRVSNYYRWERYLGGKLVRSCCYADGESAEDVGPLTPEEQAVMLDTLDRDAFPEEEDVLDIAAAWGVDPRFEKKTYPPSVGWLLTW